MMTFTFKSLQEVHSIGFARGQNAYGRPAEEAYFNTIPDFMIRYLDENRVWQDYNGLAKIQVSYNSPFTLEEFPLTPFKALAIMIISDSIIYDNPAVGPWM